MTTVTLGENILTLRVASATLEDTVRRKNRRKCKSDCEKMGGKFASYAKMMIL